FQHWHDKIRASAREFHECNSRWLTFGIDRLGGDVGDVDGLLRLQKPAHGVPRVWARRIAPKMFGECKPHLLHGSGVKDVSIITEENAEISLAEPCRIRKHRLEDWPELAGRGRYNTQDL